MVNVVELEVAMACVVLNELLWHRHRPGRFVDLSSGYFSRLRDSYSEESEQYGRSHEIVDELAKMPYLVIDDLGVQRGTEWEAEMLYTLIDSRYSEERFTVVTTNAPLDEVKQISAGRIY